MFRNTGELSLYLGFGIIGLALLGLLIICFLYLRTSIDSAKLDKVVDTAKWFVVSVAIVVAAAVVSDSFKEREAEIKELDFFDKYTATVTKADGIPERRLLAEYFATVAPSGEFRDAWKAYEGIIDKQEIATKQALADRTELEKIPNPTDAQKQKRIELSQLIETQQKPLVSPAESNAPVEWFVIAGTDESLPDAKAELEKVRPTNGDARIYEIGTNYITLIPHFASRDDALKRLTAVQKIRSDAFVQKSSCSNLREMADYVLCSQ